MYQAGTLDENGIAAAYIPVANVAGVLALPRAAAIPANRPTPKQMHNAAAAATSRNMVRILKDINGAAIWTSVQNCHGRAIIKRVRSARGSV